MRIARQLPHPWVVKNEIGDALGQGMIECACFLAADFRTGRGLPVQMEPLLWKWHGFAYVPSFNSHRLYKNVRRRCRLGTRER